MDAKRFDYERVVVMHLESADADGACERSTDADGEGSPCCRVLARVEQRVGGEVLAVGLVGVAHGKRGVAEVLDDLEFAGEPRVVER